MADMTHDATDARHFLTRLWNLENQERPGFMIGYMGPRVKGGASVRSALFSTEGPDSVRIRLLDPERFLKAQLREIEEQCRLRGDYVPSLCPALGVIGIPSAFGCEVIWWENDLPAVRPALHEGLAGLFDMILPNVTAGELGRVLEYTRYFIRETEGRFPIRMADIQGPLDSAALVAGHSNFLTALRTEPEAAHRLLRIVTDLSIAFVREQRDIVRTAGVEFVPSLFHPWLPDGFGVAVSNDECVMISAEAHDEFSVPYLNMLSEEFGGLYVHSCGNWSHQFPSLERIHNLRGLEFGASEVPFERVYEHFGGRVMLSSRVGLHRERKFNGMAEYIGLIRKASKTNRGLFINVDVTNGIIDDTWPETDLNNVYAMLAP